MLISADHIPQLRLDQLPHSAGFDPGKAGFCLQISEKVGSGNPMESKHLLNLSKQNLDLCESLELFPGTIWKGHQQLLDLMHDPKPGPT